MESDYIRKIRKCNLQTKEKISGGKPTAIRVESRPASLYAGVYSSPASQRTTPWNTSLSVPSRGRLYP